MKKFKVKTPRHELEVEAYYSILNKKDFEINKEFFKEKCKSCRNYNKKYSCPPLSPSFNDHVKEDNLFVLVYLMKLDQFKEYNEFHKIRIANAVLKPRIEKVMRKLEEKYNSKFLSTGACRLCKPCQLVLKKPCKHPDKRRYSLESLGVNCDILTRKFNLPLLWYKDSKAPEYTLVVCALPLKENVKLEELESYIN